MLSVPANAAKSLKQSPYNSTLLLYSIFLLFGIQYSLGAQAKAETQDRADASSQTLTSLLENRLRYENNDEVLRQYPVPPPRLSFGHEYEDNYYIAPDERPIPLTPALPLSPEEIALQKQALEAQKRAVQKREKLEARRFIRNFRLGISLEMYIGLPHFMTTGEVQTQSLAPTPFLFDPRITDAAARNKQVPVYNNFYQISFLLHFNQFLEFKFGIGYQSDYFTSEVDTLSDRKRYSQNNITKGVYYTMRYQRDQIFYEFGLGFTLPWVLSGRYKIVLGLKLSGGIAFGNVTAEHLQLLMPVLPNTISIFEFDPAPIYTTLSTINRPARSVQSRFSASLHIFFEILGFRISVGYALRYFPKQLYADSNYYILQSFKAGAPISFSSISFPREQILHNIHLTIGYLINPSELFRRRSSYRGAKEARNQYRRGSRRPSFP